MSLTAKEKTQFVKLLNKVDVEIEDYDNTRWGLCDYRWEKGRLVMVAGPHDESYPDDYPDEDEYE